MRMLVFTLCVTSLYLEGVQSDDNIPIYIGAFLPTRSDSVLREYESVLEHAIADVNNSTDILSGYELRLIGNYTEMLPDRGLHALYDFINNQPQLTMLFGPTYSSVAAFVNSVAAMYNLIQIGYASSPLLRDKQSYPLTVQIYPVEDVMNPARVAFVKQFRWKRVAIVFDTEHFRSNVENLLQLLTNADINILTVETISYDPSLQIQSLKRHDARIIFLMAYIGETFKVFCQAYLEGIYGRRYVWIIPGWLYDFNWDSWETFPWETLACTKEEVRTAMEYYIGFVADPYLQDLGLVDFNGVKLSSSQEAYIKSIMNINMDLTLSYDAIMVMALAMNSSIPIIGKGSPAKRLEDFKYDSEDLSTILLDEIRKTNFTGVSGKVIFDELCSRQTDVGIEQYDGVNQTSIGKYHRDIMAIQWYQEIFWQGGTVPVDGVTMVPISVSIPYIHRVVMWALAGFGCFFAVVLLAINIVFRNERAIKISSPSLNNFTGVGCLLLYVCVFVFGIDTGVTSNDGYLIAACWIRVILLSIGISLSFGGLYMKTYRIHVIFNSALKKMKMTNLPDTKLIAGIIGLVLIDVFIFTIWILVDEMKLTKSSLNPIFDTEHPALEIYNVPEILYCTSKYELYVSIGIYCYKGILLIWGVFLAWETKRVSLKTLNDSTYIALSIYIVSITCTIVLPIIYLHGDDVTFTFTFLTSAIIVVTTATLCLVFLPKILLLRNDPNDLSISIMNMSSYSQSELKDTKSLAGTYQKKKEYLDNLRGYLLFANKDPTTN